LDGRATDQQGAVPMRAMIINKADENTEAGIPPSQELLVGVGNLVDEMVKAGVLLVGEGVQPSSKGARVKVTDGRRTVTDGPFAETKELIGGIMLVQVRSMDEAIEWAARLAEILESEVEVRPVVELSDFDGVLPPEEIARQQQAHDRLAGG
jgi:hypothetical protein